MISTLIYLACGALYAHFAIEQLRQENDALCEMLQDSVHFWTLFAVLMLCWPPILVIDAVAQIARIQ